MKEFISNKVKKIAHEIYHRAESAEHLYIIFGVFGLITYPVYHLIWWLSDPAGYENLGMRLIAVGLCIPLIFKNYVTAQPPINFLKIT